MTEFEEQLIKQLDALNNNLSAKFHDPDMNKDLTFVEALIFLKRAVVNLAVRVDALDKTIYEKPVK